MGRVCPLDKSFGRTSKECAPARRKGNQERRNKIQEIMQQSLTSDNLKKENGKGDKGSREICILSTCYTFQRAE